MNCLIVFLLFFSQVLLWCLPATVFTLCTVKLKGITLYLSLIHTGHRAAFDYGLRLEMALLTRRPLTPGISVPIYLSTLECCCYCHILELRVEDLGNINLRVIAKNYTEHYTQVRILVDNIHH